MKLLTLFLFSFVVASAGDCQFKSTEKVLLDTENSYLSYYVEEWDESLLSHEDLYESKETIQYKMKIHKDIGMN